MKALHSKTRRYDTGAHHLDYPSREAVFFSRCFHAHTFFKSLICTGRSDHLKFCLEVAEPRLVGLVLGRGRLLAYRH